MLKRSSFRTLFGRKRVSGSQTQLKPAPYTFYPNFLLLSDKFSWEKPALVRSGILGLFLNTLMAYHMFSLQNWEKFLQQVET